MRRTACFGNMQSKENVLMKASKPKIISSRVSLGFQKSIFNELTSTRLSEYSEAAPNHIRSRLFEKDL